MMWVGATLTHIFLVLTIINFKIMGKAKRLLSILNIKILDEKYTVNEQDGTVQCRLRCKINLNEFERQYFNFNQNFIKNVISKYLPITYIHRNHNGDFEKFYLLPNSTAKVIEASNCFDYYSGKYKEHEIIKKSELPKSNRGDSFGEVFYKYHDTFTVYATAKCHPEDEFDESVGSNVALMKAMKIANHRLRGLSWEIHNSLRKAAVEMRNFTAERYYDERKLVDTEILYKE